MRQYSITGLGFTNIDDNHTVHAGKMGKLHWFDLFWNNLFISIMPGSAQAVIILACVVGDKKRCFEIQLCWKPISFVCPLLCKINLKFWWRGFNSRSLNSKHECQFVNPLKPFIILFNIGLFGAILSNIF